MKAALFHRKDFTKDTSDTLSGAFLRSRNRDGASWNRDFPASEFASADRLIFFPLDAGI